MRSKRLMALTAALTLSGAPCALADSSVSDRLSADHSAVEVTAVPAGTTALHIAVMSDLAGDGISYLDVPASQASYTPPPATPVVDVQAFGSSGPIGGWAGRLPTTPGGTGAQISQEEPVEAGAGLEEQLTEQLANSRREERPKKKRRREEREEERREEARQEQESAPPARMVIGVDTGGWGGSTFTDLAKGGIDHVRTTSAVARYIEPEASAAGVHIATVVFGTGGAIGAIAPSGYASEVRSYFAKYGRDGGLAVEVLNEPGNDGFWSDPSNYTAYARLAKAVHEALQTLPAGSRPAEICSWDGGEASPSPSKSWGQGIKAAGALPYCDGVTVHPYGGRTGGDGGALGGRKDVELAHTEAGKPVYVTEIGWPTAVGQPSTGDSQQWTEAQQASNITEFMRWAAASGYVPMVSYFNYVDYGTNDFYGIETSARRHKLSFAALAEASSRW
ncbi:MAG TPA: hypothetical protein VK790_07755 [Solirubrobacteraceae bacterium]|jgi:hypothetical protein|nr:hypothetical protein [Solirubrobacteraceae bacterium]